VAVTYLVDRSAWAQMRYTEVARANLTRLSTFGEIATCPAIAGELLYSARNHADLLDLRGRLEALLWLETTDDAAHRMLGVQRQLAQRGQHRGVSLVDLMVAATAEAHWATVVHYDSDYERIAEVTGQPHEWIVPRGEGHASKARRPL
jgi:predicted nucleic acid-binding protein